MNIINPVKNPFSVSSFTMSAAAKAGSSTPQLIFQRKHVRSRVTLNGVFYIGGTSNPYYSIIFATTNNRVALNSILLFPTTANNGAIYVGDGSTSAAIQGLGLYQSKTNGIYVIGQTICFENYILPIGANAYFNIPDAQNSAIGYDLKFVEELL